MPILCDRDLFGQVKFIILSVRTSLRQIQFIVQSDKDYPWHATRFLTENKSF